MTEPTKADLRADIEVKQARIWELEQHCAAFEQDAAKAAHQLQQTEAEMESLKSDLQYVAAREFFLAEMVDSMNNINKLATMIDELDRLEEEKQNQN